MNERVGSAYDCQLQIDGIGTFIESGRSEIFVSNGVEVAVCIT